MRSGYLSFLNSLNFFKLVLSLNIVHLVNSLHESSHTHIVAWAISHRFFCSVVHGIKLSDLVAESDSLKKHPHFFFRARDLEIILSDAHLSKCRGE